jgi:hypothetical protein
MSHPTENRYLTMDQIDQVLMRLRRATAISTMVAGPDDGCKEPPSFSRDTLFASMHIILEELGNIREIVRNCEKEEFSTD